MKNSQTTIRDLALKLQTSISTVSRALRNAPDVNPETKRVVLEMARKLNYEPNRIAQSLRNRKTNTLGIVVPQINLHFFSSAISGIQEHASAHNYGVMICQSLENLATEISTVQMLVSNRVDGLLISLSNETNHYDHLEVLAAKKIPVVFFDRVADHLDFSRVTVDDFDGAGRAVEHLVRTGCRKIAYIGGPHHLYISNERLNGYLHALRRHQLSVNEDLIVNCSNFDKDPANAVREMVNGSTRPDAIFCMNDPIAIQVLQTLKALHVSVPDDVSVVGFTNEPSSNLIEPSLTTVSQPSQLMGRLATEILLQQIETKENFVPVKKVVETELIIRNSTRKMR